MPNGLQILFPMPFVNQNADFEENLKGPIKKKKIVCRMWGLLRGPVSEI